MNFGSNAVKFTPRDGIVQLGISLLEPDMEGIDAPRNDTEVHSVVLRIVVRDTGIGMSPEVQRRLFEPFEQVCPIFHCWTAIANSTIQQCFSHSDPTTIFCCQADAGAMRRFGGTRLGLAISAHLAAHMGFVSVDEYPCIGCKHLSSQVASGVHLSFVVCLFMKSQLPANRRYQYGRSWVDVSHRLTS